MVIYCFVEHIVDYPNWSFPAFLTLLSIVYNGLFEFDDGIFIYPIWSLSTILSFITIVRVGPHCMPLLIILFPARSSAVIGLNIDCPLRFNLTFPDEVHKHAFGSKLYHFAHIPPKRRLQPQPAFTNSMTFFHMVRRNLSFVLSSRVIHNGHRNSFLRARTWWDIGES